MIAVGVRSHKAGCKTRQPGKDNPAATSGPKFHAGSPWKVERAPLATGDPFRLQDKARRATSGGIDAMALETGFLKWKLLFRTVAMGALRIANGDVSPAGRERIILYPSPLL